jgi:hypothetical protein
MTDAETSRIVEGAPGRRGELALRAVGDLVLGRFCSLSEFGAGVLFGGLVRRAAPRGTLRRPDAGRLPSGAELVSAALLAIEPFLELDPRDPLGRVQVDPLTLRVPDATPLAHHREILEERRFDREDVKPGHVLSAVDPLKHENLKKGRIVRVWGDRPKLSRISRSRPTNDLNRSQRSDSEFESIAN